MSLKNISIIGLGKLGCCIFTTLASKGFNVIGIDIDKNVVDKINNSMSPHYEQGLDELIKENKNRLAATTDYSVIANTDLTIVMLPTPSDENGGFSTKYIEKAVRQIMGSWKPVKKLSNEKIV